MQIYEITKKPRVNEVLGAIASTVGKALANKAASTQGISLDDPGGREGPYASATQRQGAAMKMNAGMTQALAKKAQEAWTTEIQNMIVKSEPPVMSAAQLEQIKPNTVAAELQTLINSLAGFDVTTLAAAKDTTGQSQLLAKELEKAKEAVVNATIAPRTDPAAMKSAWQSLATMISQAQNTRQFAGAEAGAEAQISGRGQPAKTSTGPDGKPLFNGKPYNKTDPAHRLTIQQFGLDPDTYVPRIA
jgi:hypothetical protein